MRGKKWLLTVVCALLLVGVVCVLGNWLIDPFGVFEASPLQWDSYAQTLNPRGSKVRYISERPGEYDSFVVGSSSAASYLPETLERYYGGSFYNMFHYGADTDYDRELVRYLLEQGEVKRIVLVLGLSDAYALHSKTEGLTAVPDYRVSGENEAAYKLRFLFASPSFAMEKLSSLRKDTEMPQTFDVFLPESGTYDKRLRDVESIGSLQDYLTLHGEDYLSETADTTLPDIERCAGNVAAIREMCGEAGTELTVILTPFCREQIEQYDNAALNAFYQALSDVTDYWNFSITPLTYDERFFYDVTHTRNAAANLVLARIAGDESVGLPDAFGAYCRQGESTDAAQLKTAAEESAYLQNGSATVPILLYHHLDPDQPESETTLHPDTFERQMRLLKEQGYTPISFDELIAFVEQGTPLPEKPVMITFDDGYTSNAVYAYPVLRELGFHASIFAIGCSIGHDRYYKDTQYSLTPHFGQTEITEMLDSGLISIGSHTYDMHQWPPYETVKPARENMLPLPGESETEYIDAVQTDAAREAENVCGVRNSQARCACFPRGCAYHADRCCAARMRLQGHSDDGRKPCEYRCGRSAADADRSRPHDRSAGHDGRAAPAVSERAGKLENKAFSRARRACARRVLLHFREENPYSVVEKSGSRWYNKKKRAAVRRLFEAGEVRQY